MKPEIRKAVHNIFEINLNVKKTERVIVFTDGFNRNLKRLGKLVAGAGINYAKEINYIEFRPTGCHGTEPPEEIWKAAYGVNVYDQLKKKRLLGPLIAKKATEKQIRDTEGIVKKYRKEAADVVIALSYFSTSHTKFRDMLNNICGSRYASMPLFDEPMLTGVMTVDWKRMFERTKRIAERVNRAEMIEISAPNGTDITFSKKGRRAEMDTGIITRAGQFSNLPAGEVYLAPLEGTAYGRLVLDWAPTRKLRKPVTLHIEKGFVKKVEGKERFVKYLEEKLSEKKENGNIAELGIGTNDKATRPDNILESEKIFGTIHIALGDNSSFGGIIRTSFHQDFVFFKPDITLVYKNGRSRKLMEKGKIK